MHASPRRIRLQDADDVRDVVHSAVAEIAGGGLVVLPTESSPLLAALATSERGCARLAALDIPERAAIVLADARAVADWVPNPPRSLERLTLRGWPGPLVVSVTSPHIARGVCKYLSPEARTLLERGADDSTRDTGMSVAMRAPRHGFIQDVVRLAPGPMIAVPAPRSPGPAEVDLWIEDANDDRPESPVSIEFLGERWRVAGAGDQAANEQSIMAMTSTLIVFVCTGNTCRSPMAEALCKRRLAAMLGCKPHELESRGIVVLSAGLAAAPGAPAAPEAMDIVADRGATLEGHAARRLTPQMIEQADLVVAMTADHRDAILHWYPEAAPRVRLLDQRGRDIADPIGRGREVYELTADEIEAALEDVIAMLDLEREGT